MQDFKYKAFIFDLDNTLYPEKDYLFQIYYLMGKYLEEKENKNAREITEFLIFNFENVGRERLLDKALEKFEVDGRYMADLLQIMRNAKLPLKLLLFQKMFDFIQSLLEEKSTLFILTNGNPEQQLNKIKQIDWQGIEKHLLVYFANEFKPKPAPDGVLHILEKFQLQKSEVVFIGDSKEDEYCAKAAGIDFYHADNILK